MRLRSDCYSNPLQTRESVTRLHSRAYNTSMCRQSPNSNLAMQSIVMNTINIVQVNGQSDHKAATSSNRNAWDAIADWWDKKQNETGQDGNDMFTQCLLPQVEQLVDWQPGQNVLDLGAGSGIICRMFARKGAQVTGLDYSLPMLDKARKSAFSEGLEINYEFIDLMDLDNMKEYASKHPEYV